MMKIDLNYCLVLLSIGLFCSCTYNEGSLPVPENNGPKITYTSHAKTIIDNHCVVCHSPTAIPVATTPFLTNYSEVVAATPQRIKARAIDNSPSSMPPLTPLPQTLKDTLQLWINDGGLE